MEVLDRPIEAGARLRQKNQLTVPEPIVRALDAALDDILSSRPTRPSLASPASASCPATSQAALPVSSGRARRRSSSSAASVEPGGRSRVSRSSLLEAIADGDSPLARYHGPRGILRRDRLDPSGRGVHPEGAGRDGPEPRGRLDGDRHGDPRPPDACGPARSPHPRVPPHAPNLVCVPVDLQVAQDAAHLRADKRLAPPDALIVGTGLAAQVRHLVTNDDNWSTKLASMSSRISVVRTSSHLPFP